MICKRAKTVRLTYDNTTVQAVLAGNNITFTTVKDNLIVPYANGIIYLKSPGIYKISANFTAIATAIGATEIALMEGNTTVSGARSIGTAAAVGDAVPLAFNTLLNVFPGQSGSYAAISFQAVNSTSIEVANVLIEKVE